MTDTRSSEPQRLGEFNGFEVYPMPVFATLAAGDVAATAAWYERALGFRPMFRGGPVVHLRRRKYQDLLVVPAGAEPRRPGTALTLCFDADGELDALAAQARAAAPLGRSAVEGLYATPWNTRELRVTDPAGNVLVFNERDRRASPEDRERMRRRLEAGRTR